MFKVNKWKNEGMNSEAGLQKDTLNHYGNNLIPYELTLILKGIAILLVVICHLGNEFTRWFTPLGGIGVTIFLILSAYGLEKSYQKNGLRHYWKKRFLAVWVPYVLVELLTAPLHTRGVGIRTGFLI